MTFACEINVRDAIGIFQFGIAGKAVEDKRESLVSFYIAGPFEIFVQHRADQIPCGGNKACRARLIRKLPADQTIVVCEIDIHLHIHRSA